MGTKEKYCRCIMHVANQYPKYNPYAVCNRVYTAAGQKRKGVVRCAETYKFEDFKTEELRGYARMKKNKIPGWEGMSREELIDALYKFVAAEKGREVWQEYAKRYRKNHPDLSFAEAMKRASREYGDGKKKL